MYGYNPYGNYMPQRPIEQSRPMLNGKVLENEDMVKITEIPLDGSTSYFPLANGSKIITKQLQLDGTSKTIVYEPINEKQEIIKYATMEDLSTLEDKIKEINKSIKELKKEKDE